MEREGGEMSDDNTMQVDEDTLENHDTTAEQAIADHTVLYKAEKEGLIIKKLEKVDAAKLEERAKRFGLNLTGNRVITQTQIDELYKNFGIDGNERHFRLDAIYLNGVDGLTTREIFEYLEDYKPSSLEWIDEMSCNVVCQDHISAALAILLHSREIKSQELKDMLAQKSSHHWREGMPHSKKELILMRFATNAEKKKLNKKPDLKHIDEYYDQSMDSISKNPWGDLCRSWGVYDHQEVFQWKPPKVDYEDDIEEPNPPPIHIRNKKLAMRLGKKRISTDNNSNESCSDSEWRSKSKAPRMRMHADDEESKQRKWRANTPTEKRVQNIQRERYAPLSIEVVNTSNDIVKREPTKLSDKFKFHGGQRNSTRSRGIQSRLGEIVICSNDSSSKSEYSSEESAEESNEVNITSKVQKVRSNNKHSNSTSAWSRLDAKGHSSSAKSDLRQMLKSKSSKPKNTNDLRQRLGKSNHANLRIEIDNK